MEEMLTLPRTPQQRWVYLSDESQTNSPLYPQYRGPRQYNYFLLLFTALSENNSSVDIYTQINDNTSVQDCLTGR